MTKDYEDGFFAGARAYGLEFQHSAITTNDVLRNLATKFANNPGKKAYEVYCKNVGRLFPKPPWESLTDEVRGAWEKVMAIGKPSAEPYQIPTQQENPRGLHQRYTVKKINGNDDPRAFYFVLRLDPHGDDPLWTDICRRAARKISEMLEAEEHLPKLAEDLQRWAAHFEREIC